MLVVLKPCLVYAANLAQPKANNWGPLNSMRHHVAGLILYTGKVPDWNFQLSQPFLCSIFGRPISWISLFEFLFVSSLSLKKNCIFFVNIGKNSSESSNYIMLTEVKSCKILCFKFLELCRNLEFFSLGFRVFLGPWFDKKCWEKAELG